jgi:hypothetical protein
MIRWIFPKLESVAPFLARKFFIKIFFTPLRYKVPQKEKDVLSSAEKFQVDIGNKRIQCYSWGNEGPLVLLVHGWAGRASQFRKFIDVFVKEKFRVVAFDGPAHGHSDGRVTNIAEFETALRKVTDRVGEPDAIVAHSFGGGAVLFAAMNGLPVKKLINIASPTIGDEIINTYLKTIGGTWRVTGDFFKSYILRKYQKPFEAFTALHFLKNMPQHIDLLLIHDEEDQEVSIQHPLEILKIYPSAQLYKTMGLGHTRILKDESVIQHCVTFIKSSRLSGRENEHSI